MYIPKGPTDLMLRSKAHNLCSTYSFINVIFMLNISHYMQHVVGCPTWEHSHPNRCWVSKWEHGYLNRFSVSKMGTWLSKSMFDFPTWNMVFQIDVGFPTWENDLPSRCWISKMGT